MKVKNKILLLLFLLSIGFALVTVFYLGVESSRINELFKESAEKRKESFENLFRTDHQELLTIISEEYGLWDDMAQFVKNPTQEFSGYNLDWMIEGYNLSAVWVFDPQRKAVYSKSSDSLANPEFPFHNKEFFDTLSAYNELYFYGSVNGVLTEFMATSVHDSFQKYEQNIIDGYLVICKSFADKLKEHFETITGSTINVSFDLAKNDTTIHTNFASGLSTFELVVIDWRDLPVAKLEVTMVSEFVSEYYNSSGDLITLYITFCILLLGGFYLLHHLFVTKPFSIITTALNNEDVSRLDKYIRSDNEFGQLSRLINNFFKHKIRLVTEIHERERAEKALRELNRELELKAEERAGEIQLLIDQSPLAVATYSREGYLITINKKFKTLFHDFLEDSSDIASFAEQAGLDSAAIKEKFNQLIEHGDEFSVKHKLETHVVNSHEKSSKKFIFRFYGIVNESGKVLKVVNMVEDISEIDRIEKAEQEVERQKVITEKILEAQEEERKRIAMELHDGIGQLLTSARISISDYLRRSKSKDEKLITVSSSISSVGKELINIIHHLHPVDLEKFGLEGALRSLCKEFSTLSSCSIVFNVFGIPPKLPFKYEITIYRITQEALTNIYKYSDANEASVELFFRDGHLYLEISDDGVGFDLDIINSPEFIGRGIENMMRRTELLGGNYLIDSKKKFGTEIHINIPVVYEV